MNCPFILGIAELEPITTLGLVIAKFLPVTHFGALE
jgi:hypothetical protein